MLVLLAMLLLGLLAAWNFSGRAAPPDAVQALASAGPAFAVDGAVAPQRSTAWALAEKS
ncbi:hypothetical protein [Pelomonas sp. SE-A7]|uniref:hypothetical protein n=1 Tax=Pelomonas sp. SE-A7 TaxID=3054953 RepID=UPI00259D2F1B|nr:hypothetical protein [Pelomonas sp. SE-A7]MDM4764575.1 hypothetical protein [Pelomonas sp. SE-A7]